MSETDTTRRFTDTAWWDAYWEGLELPAEVSKSENFLVEAITDVFDTYVPGTRDFTALEIGGSSGRYLVYLHRRWGCRVHVLENSPVGAEAARRNFELLNIPGTVTLGDMLDDTVALEPVDLVYSLGLIEHFDDPTAIARAHLRFLKPGGTLVIGVPNLTGINGVLFRRLSPSIFDTHDVGSADLERWGEFERALGLETVFKAHIGGFEPGLFWRVETGRKSDVALALALKRAEWLLNRSWTRRLRRLNHPAWSAYGIAVYRAPAAAR